MRAGFARRLRLRTGAEFDAVWKRGRRLGGRLFLLVALPNRRGRNRLGLAVSRRVGGAVERNRARRLLREGFRRAPRAKGAGFDLVAVAQPEIVACTQAEVDRELRERLRRVEASARPGGAPAAAGG